MAGDYHPPELMDQTVSRSPAANAGLSPDWAVVILASEETIATLTATIDTVIVACGDHSAVIDVVVNGNALLADCIARSVGRFAQRGRQTAQLRIWSAPVPDKAHGWNLYVHHIWTEAALTFFVDGGSRSGARSLSQIAASIGQAPMVADGTGDDTLQAIRAAALNDFRARQFRLPLGLYSGDTPVDMDVQPEVSWWSRPVSPWRPRDFLTRARGLFREARRSHDLSQVDADPEILAQSALGRPAP